MRASVGTACRDATGTLPGEGAPHAASHVGNVAATSHRALPVTPGPRSPRIVSVLLHLYAE